MRIIKRKEFLNLTPPVIYSKVNCGCLVAGMFVATQFIEDDWFFTSLNPRLIPSPSSALESCDIDYDGSERDGSFDDEDIVEFLIYEQADIQQLITALQHYSNV